MSHSRKVLPPFYFLVTAATMAGLHFLAPIGMLLHPPITDLGALLIAFGLGVLCLGSRHLCQSRDTDKAVRGINAPGNQRDVPGYEKSYVLGYGRRPSWHRGIFWNYQPLHPNSALCLAHSA